MDNVKLFEKRDWYFLVSIITLLFSLFVTIFSALQTSDKECTLYFIQNDESVLENCTSE